ncbi:anthranilate phosphoribosyltransferase, chloroplastic-like [Pistacia vera]|uniref:anthranilate phosphoribosyltransferase, chloroplastic-like n=1 Tax=Pistacia vera TaxID=55513 RepID=UPI0012632379|nr:anthranilate phosphoribosyltransferase, chloroplastic-like [Pistacia vera]
MLQNITVRLFAEQHGSRSSFLACGSADVLEALGVVLDLGTGGCNKILKIANTLQWFGMKRALVVDSEGLDEMSPLVKFRIPRGTLASQLVYDVKVLRDVLSGKRGPIADAFITSGQILNAAAALLMSSHVNRLAEGVSLACSTGLCDRPPITKVHQLKGKYARKVEGLDGVVDIVGTGGDGANTVNISTGASILAVACSAKVAKCGSRSSSCACGSVDVLEALGVVLDLGREDVTRCVNEVGIGFMMSPKYHPVMNIVRPVRKTLKVKIVFNILGPMLNLAQVPFAVVGVYSEDLVLEIANMLQRFGMKRALVVDSEGLDEMSPLGPGLVLDVTPEKIERFSFDPLKFRIPWCTFANLLVYNVKRGPILDAFVSFLCLLSSPNECSLFLVVSRISYGHMSHWITIGQILNATTALLVSSHVSNLVEGVSLACETLALKILDLWIEISRNCFFSVLLGLLCGFEPFGRSFPSNLYRS